MVKDCFKVRYKTSTQSSWRSLSTKIEVLRRLGTWPTFKVQKSVSISLAIDLARAKCHRQLVSATAWSQKKYLCCCCQSSELSSGASSQLLRGESRAANVLILFDIIQILILLFTQFYDSTISSIPHRNNYSDNWLQNDDRSIWQRLTDCKNFVF